MSGAGPEKIFLVGFMGAGKTTVGELLARRLGWEFVDLDDEIRRRTGRPIAAIFAAEGEDFFRRLEAEVLRGLPAGMPQVVATGGGAYAVEENASWIEARGFTVWLRCPLDRIRRRCREGEERPLLREAESLPDLLARREPFYRRARLHLDAGRLSPEEIVDRIVAALPPG